MKILEESNGIAQKFLTEDTFSENEVIRTYRQAYQKFKTKKGARSSIEALLKRSTSDRPVTTISPLVDIYNAASLRFGLPCGAEDLDTFVGNLQLTVTEGGDEFYLIGDETTLQLYQVMFAIRMIKEQFVAVSIGAMVSEP